MFPMRLCDYMPAPAWRWSGRVHGKPVPTHRLALHYGRALRVRTRKEAACQVSEPTGRVPLGRVLQLMEEPSLPPHYYRRRVIRRLASLPVIE
jgi:hypothetical protein